jgi:predicted nucleic acid-binding Zn ribbon protein
MDSIRPIVEQYTTLRLVTIPVSGKRPVSVVLDEHGQPLRRPDGSAIRWQPFTERFPTDAELEAFEWERATGLAVVIGPATWRTWPHLWSLDVEAEFRNEAEQWLDQHVPHWRDGVVVETGSGGLHVYFLASHPVTTGVVRWGEVRGQGALCVLPPSRHPETGRSYRWLSEQWTNLPQFEPSSVPGYGGRAENDHQAEPLDVASVLAGVPLGQRNQALFRLACKLRGAGIPIEWTTRLVAEAASNCIPPWGSSPDEEPAERLAERVYSRYQPNPTLVVGSTPPLATGNGHHHSLITANNESESDEPEAVDVSTLPEPPRRGWLVPDLVPEGTVSCWYGDDGTGKSILAQTLAICIASGQPFLDRPVQQGVVLYVDTEFDQDEFIRRAYQLARGMGFTAPPAGVLYFRTRYSLTTPGGQRDIACLVERYQPTLLIIDSLTLGSYSSDLKEASETTSLMEFLQQLSVTVLALDHIPKPLPGTSLAYARPFGSFAKRAKSRHAVLVVPSEGGGIVLRVTKSNLAKAGAMVGADITWTDDAIRVTAVSLDDDALAGVEHHLPALEQVYRCLCQHEAMTPEELAEETGLAVGTIRNKLTALRHQGRAEPLGDGRWRGIAPATLVVRDDGHRGVITITGSKVSDGDDEDGKPENPHQNCEIGGHDPAGVTGETELSHQEAKIGGHGCVVCGKPVAHWGEKPARFCSDSCRKKFTRQQGATGRVTTVVGKADSGPPDPGICLDCGQPITAEGFLYRCPPCLQALYDKLQRQYPEKLVRWLEQQHGR